MSNFLTGNRGKLLLAGVLLVAAGLMTWRLLSRDGRLPGSFNFVCVETGKTYSISRKDIIQVPAENPDTGETTLLPCEERDGVLYVCDHYARSIDVFGDRNHYVDPETLAVRTQ